MTLMAKTSALFAQPVKAFSSLLVTFALFIVAPQISAHPLEYHLEPLKAEDVERVLVSFELLTAKLETAGLLATARTGEEALGVTAVVWSVEDAIAAMDETRSVESPTLLQALGAAGYEDSPYVVAEWKVEAERVLEAFEVLQGDFQTQAIGREMAVLEENAAQLTGEEIAERQMVLIRQASMLKTTAGDISQVAPFRQRLEALTSQLHQ